MTCLLAVGETHHPELAPRCRHDEENYKCNDDDEHNENDDEHDENYDDEDDHDDDNNEHDNDDGVIEVGQ